jgi:hypothetical protein
MSPGAPLVVKCCWSTPAPPKAEAGRNPVIPVQQFALDALAAYLTRTETVEAELPWRETDADTTIKTTHVFGLTTSATIGHSIKERAAKAGGTWSPNDLRHLYFSTLEQNGIPPRTIQEVMGREPPRCPLRQHVGEDVGHDSAAPAVSLLEGLASGCARAAS